MCGLAGILSRQSELIDKHKLIKMGNAISHRGPDDSGVWFDAEAGIGFSHRRLAIVDLSQAGHQPMQSASGRYVMSYNGEIYNHSDMRSDLERRGVSGWRGHSDTETLLASFDVLGIEATLESAIGMFAVALWDRHSRTLTLARDRLGEKPLYYGWQGNVEGGAFLFGSDLAALRQHASFDPTEDTVALHQFLQLGYVPATRSIHASVKKLSPGHLLQISLEKPQPTISSFWNRQAVLSPANRFSGSPVEAVDRLETLAMKAVGRQMVADVALGAFLSGGVDSSTVSALMQAQSTRPIKTFSIGFGDAEHNEARFAALVAKHLGTEHHELYVTAEMVLDVVPKLATMYSEPFADSSQIPVYLVSQLARTSVTVALSGDGGDELFAGYNRYVLTARYSRIIQSIPYSMRSLAAGLMARLKPQHWSKIQRLFGSNRIVSKLSEKAPKIQQALVSLNADEFYRHLISVNDEPNTFISSVSNSAGVELPYSLGSSVDSAIMGMMACDMDTYLPDDILCKVDRAAMAVSLETRVPFLDHELVEFAWSLPLSLKLRENQGKWVLRQLLDRYVPRTLIDRPKMGFSIPLDIWLRGPLKAWASDLVHQTGDALDDRALQALWNRHINDGADHGSALWPLLMYRAWRQGQA